MRRCPDGQRPHAPRLRSPGAFLLLRYSDGLLDRSKKTFMSSKSMLYAALLAVAVFWAVGAHNRLVRLKNAIARDFGAVDTQLRLRYAQIAQLLDITASSLSCEVLSDVRQAMAQASTALDAARSHPSTGRNVGMFAEAERRLDLQLTAFWYSDGAVLALRADPGLRQVAKGIGSLDSKLDFACEPYNRAVENFNQAQAEFPTLVIARVFGFSPSAPLRIAEQQTSRAALRALL